MDCHLSDSQIVLHSEGPYPLDRKGWLFFIGRTVSLLPLSSAVTGITLEGFEYPLQDGTMEIVRPYGMSNRLIEARGVISVASGYLLVVRYFKAGVFPRCDLKG